MQMRISLNHEMITAMKSMWIVRYLVLTLYGERRINNMLLSNNRNVGNVSQVGTIDRYYSFMQHCRSYPYLMFQKKVFLVSQYGGTSSR